MTVLKMYRKRAFSLIEVLLVLALIGIMVGMVAGNAGAFIKGGNFEPPDRVLKKAVLDAVYSASESKRLSFLSFLEENATFLVTDQSGKILATHQVYEKIDDEIRGDRSLMPSVTFRAIGPLRGEGGGRTKYDDWELELRRVVFHSGSSTPFEAEIDFRDSVQKLQFDPFSGYVLKNKE